MVTYNIKYYYNSQSTITTTATDLDVDYPYSMLNTLLSALTTNQLKNLLRIEIVSGINNKFAHGYKKIIDLSPNYPFYKVVLSADKINVTKGDTVNLTTTVTNISSVTKVEFFLGSTKLGEDTSAPFIYNYVTDKIGTYLVTAKVTDSDNVVTVSNAVTLTIQ